MTTTPRAPEPPRLARWLLRHLLDGAARSAIVGDLDEEFVRFVLPERGRRAARRWYWRQTLGSIVACLRGPSDRNLAHDEGQAPSFRTFIHDRGGLSSDVRDGLRSCLRRPGLSLVVILTLAVGIGANTALFAIVNALFLKRLPIANAERLVAIEPKEGGWFSYAEYLAMRSATGLSAVVAGGRIASVLQAGDQREWVTVDVVTANFFDALGVRPAAGARLFGEDDEAVGRGPAGVLSDQFWRQRFARDPSVVGQTIRLGQSPFTIVGVAPAGFAGASLAHAPDLWIPLTQGPLAEGNRRMLDAQGGWLGLLGILETRDSLATARGNLQARWRQTGGTDDILLRRIPRGLDLGWAPPGHDAYLTMLGCFVVLILVIGCLNVSTLLAAGVHSRRKELAIRAALGAGRLRLLRQLLVEHAALAAAGGLLAAPVGLWTARVIVGSTSTGDLPRDLDVGLDLNVLIFTGAVSLISALVFGVAPALRWSRVSGVSVLQGTTGEGMPRLFRHGGLWWLIPWQVALGSELLASAGFLMKTVQQLKLGIESAAPERVWFATLEFESLPAGPTHSGDLADRLTARLQHLPDIETAAISTLRPLASSSRTPLDVEGIDNPPASRPMPWGPPPPPPPLGAQLVERERWIVSNSYVSPGFFRSLGLPLLQGRDFEARDDLSSTRVAIVNETFARRAFGRSSPIGRRLARDAARFDIEIIGVVKDLRYEHLREAAPDGVFFPLAQIPSDEASTQTVTGAQVARDLTLIVRVRPGGRIGAGQLREQVAAVDPRVLVERIWTFDEEAGRALGQERMLAWLGSAFGVIALLLLVVGLYGTLTTAVNRGRRELGIRLALGASPLSLRVMVVGRSLLVVACGLLVGLPLSYVAARSFAHLLYGVRPIEPLVAGGVALAVLLTTALSAYLPARRAAHVDPIVALRVE
jgi:hypothetical protein